MVEPGGRRRLKSEIGTLALPGNPAARRVRLTDERSGIRVCVVPEAGGEIASFQVRLAGKWTEILYRAEDYYSKPPDGWDGRAPLLWPAVGRSLTPEQIAQWSKTGRKPRSCRWALRGKTYRIPGHGFARKLPWELEGFGAGAPSAWVRCSLRSSPATRLMYPFDFALSATCTLAGGSVLLRYEATAGSNREKMPFAIGNHISLRVPFTRRGRFEDCTIRTPGEKRLRLDKLNLLSGACERVDLRRPTALARKEFLDMLLSGYRRDNAWFELADPASLTMRVSQAEQRAGGNFLAAERDILFVLWGSRKLRYFCPEPWIGWPNALNSSRVPVALPAGGRFAWQVRFTPVRH